MRTRASFLFIVLAALTLFLFMLDLSVGAVAVPLRDVWAALTGGDCPRTTAKIILNIRLTKAVVALLAGAALSVSGLQMQTLFRNPLAGPYVLGISSGASLGVALFILGVPLFGLRLPLPHLALPEPHGSGLRLFSSLSLPLDTVSRILW